MSSPYAQFVEAIIQEVDRSFTNALQLSQPYQSTDYLPGERRGILDLQSYGPDFDRQQLNRNRGGVEAKVIRGQILLTVAFDGAGRQEPEIYRVGNSIFLAEAFGLEDAMSEMKKEVSDQGFLYEIELVNQIDKALSVAIRDQDTWIVNITADIVIRLMVGRDIDGGHYLPLSR